MAWPQFVHVPRKVTSAGAALVPPAALLLAGAVGWACLPGPVNPMGNPWLHAALGPREQPAMEAP